MGALNGNIRSQVANEPLGCIGDLGWYNVCFTLMAFNYESPTSVSCHFHEKTSEGVPLTASGTMRYSGGRSATFDCSFKRALRQWGEFISKKKTLYLDDFVVCQSLDVSHQVYSGGIGDRALYFPKEVHQE